MKPEENIQKCTKCCVERSPYQINTIRNCACSYLAYPITFSLFPTAVLAAVGATHVVVITEIR